MPTNTFSNFLREETKYKIPKQKNVIESPNKLFNAIPVVYSLGNSSLNISFKEI